MSECIALDARKGNLNASKAISKRKRLSAQARAPESLGRAMVGTRAEEVESSWPLREHGKERSRCPVGGAVILKPFNEVAGQSQEPIYTFRVYLEEIFLPVIRRKWKESTRVTTESRMTYHLLPALGERLLQQITREQMQIFLDQKALTASRSTVDHLRGDLKLHFQDGAERRHRAIQPSSRTLHSAM
jgi:integrase-like protein